MRILARICSRKYTSACARYLNHLVESRPIYEYIAAFTNAYIDPWSVHTDAAYICCKLRACRIVSHLLTAEVSNFSDNDVCVIDHCRTIDSWVLKRIQPAYASKYIRLADNRTTFAAVSQFCMYAIDTKRNNQEYLCELVNQLDLSIAVQLIHMPIVEDLDTSCESDRKRRRAA